MKRFAFLASLLLMWVLMVSGCGDKNPKGGEHYIPTTGGITVVNATSSNLVDLYTSPTSVTTWGSDRLASVVQPGASATIDFLPPDTYDVKGVLANGTKFMVTGVAVTAGSVITIQSPTSGSIKVTNSTSATIATLYISPTSSDVWGSDQLGSAMIRPGASFTVTNIPLGLYDVKGVTTDNSEFILTNVEVIGGVTGTIEVVQSKLTPSTDTVPAKQGIGTTDGAAVYIPPAEGQGAQKQKQ